MEFSWSKLVTKVVERVVQVLVGLLVGLNLDKVGITVNEPVAVTAVIGLLEGLRNFLKIKLGWKWL